MRTNPTESKRLSMSGSKKKQEALSMRDVQDILQSLDRFLPRERMTIALLLLTGMRRGEALGLCWEHIDWDRKLIHVEQAVTFCNNQPVLGEAKSEAGNRTIPLDAQLEAILLPERKESGFVLGDGEKPLTERTFTRLWQRIGKKIDLHDAMPHIFRHTYISMMTCAKSPIFIKTTRIDRLQSKKSHGASSDKEDALRLVRFKKSSNIRKNLLQNEKKTTADGAKLVSGFWCTQQDSNLWPFDS